MGGVSGVLAYVECVGSALALAQPRPQKCNVKMLNVYF